MIVVDTPVIVAYMNRGDHAHQFVVTWLDEVDDDLATTPLIVAEVDHLVGARGTRAALTALGFRSRCRVPLADASLVALAARLGTIEIATLDERHFRAARPLAGGKTFRLLPADL